MINLIDKLVNSSRGIVKDFMKDFVMVFVEFIKFIVIVRKYLFIVNDINLVVL